MRFKDRVDGGKQLAVLLTKYKNNTDAIIIGLPRGGVVIAFEVSKELNLPLDIIVPRKIGAPTNPELAVGALTQEGAIVWNEALRKSLGLSPDDLKDIIAAEKKEAARRLRVYRGNRQPLNLKNKIVILVDDGIATGATMRAAISSARIQGAKFIVVAVPVSPMQVLEKIKQQADEVICAVTPDIFLGVGAFYDSFSQTEDAEVITLLEGAREFAEHS